MSDALGGNAAADLKQRAERRMRLEDDLDEAKEALKEAKADDKAAGYTEKALAHCIKSMRKGEDWHAEQLWLELELKTYREALGITTDLAKAQELARQAAATVPDAPPVEETDDAGTYKRKKRKTGETLQ